MGTDWCDCTEADVPVYLVNAINGDVFLVPLELKRGKLDASATVKQLQAGATIVATRMIPKRDEPSVEILAKGR